MAERMRAPQRPQRATGQVDLHLHSAYSDGLHSPRRLVELAAAVGLEAISITDHDTVEGCQEATAAGQEFRVEVIPGVELSTMERGVELHVLGYFFDPTNPHLNRHLRLFQEERVKRARKMVDLLRGMGCPVSFDDVMGRSGKGSVGRPHLAQAMVECGFVSSVGEAFALYLGEDRPAFVPKYKMATSEAIALITAAGGLAFLAHPGWNVADSLILTLAKQGLHGVETVHPRHAPGDVYHYRMLVAAHGLLETGGSDFHGAPHEAPLGTHVLPRSALEKMRESVLTAVRNGGA
ncbi:MAG: PHP domain-containing protein [Calditrichaeota bacterium]|nr:PHP domain-containing protein [Calditrichota bacterium]